IDPLESPPHPFLPERVVAKVTCSHPSSTLAQCPPAKLLSASSARLHLPTSAAPPNLPAVPAPSPAPLRSLARLDRLANRYPAKIASLERAPLPSNSPTAR